jgi:hypothetical protein
MLEFMGLIGEIHPGLFIHSVYVDEDLDKDQKAGWVRVYDAAKLRTRHAHLSIIVGKRG